MPVSPSDPWPLRHLLLRTPRLTLRPDDDEGLYELAQVALRGIHPPEQMPFRSSWTDQSPEDLARDVIQHNWAIRAKLSPSDWSIHFLVRHDGRVIGTRHLTGKDFAITREVRTASWLGAAHQGAGFGTEMGAAVLLLAFDHLGATVARSGVFSDNPASLRINEKLGYRKNGTRTYARRGTAATEIQLRLTTADLVRPEWTLEVDGLDNCRAMLGAD